jgi:hypothetical protein
MSEQIFRFVPHDRVESYTQLGWIDRGHSPGHHGAHSRVMLWKGEGSPREPAFTGEQAVLAALNAEMEAEA